MNIITIPLRCLRQKWGRSAALLSVFLLGVAAIGFADVAGVSSRSIAPCAIVNE